MKNTQTRLPRAWGKHAKSRGYRRKDVFPKSVKQLIYQFAFFKRQKKIPDLLWDEFERQCRKSAKCMGCNQGTGCEGGFLCWSCFKIDVRDGNSDIIPMHVCENREEFEKVVKPITNPNKYENDIFDEVQERWPDVPESWCSLSEFLWVKRYTGCSTGYLYKPAFHTY